MKPPRRIIRDCLGSHTPFASNRPEPLPWSGGYAFEKPHAFEAHCYAGTQCGRCWGWIDDARHLGTDRA